MKIEINESAAMAIVAFCVCMFFAMIVICKAIVDKEKASHQPAIEQAK